MTTFIERQKEAILTEAKERNAEHRQVAELVLGANPSRQRVTEVINLDGDYLVKMVDGSGEKWTFVVGGKRGDWFHKRQEDAILHLIATRYESNPNNSCSAAFYAGRVLGRPDDDN